MASPADNGADAIDSAIAISNENAKNEGNIAEDWKHNALSIVVVGASGIYLQSRPAYLDLFLLCSHSLTPSMGLHTSSAALQAPSVCRQ